MYQMPDCENLDEAMLAVNEVYQAAVRAGFTKHQALHVALADACCKREDDE